MKNELIVLIVLCWMDAVFTDIGIRYFHVEEANPLMNFLYQKSIFLFYAFKMIFPATLLFIVLKCSKINDVKYIKYLLNMSSILYIGLMGYHVFWMILSQL